MPTKSARKLIDLCASVFPLIYVFVERGTMLWIIGILLGLLLSLDVGRLYSTPLSALTERIMGRVLRPPRPGP